MKNFHERFFDPEVVSGYNVALVGNTHTDQLAFQHYADIFAAFASGLGTDFSAVDLGCGPGHVGLAFQQKTRCQMTMVDISPLMIDQAQVNITQAIARSMKPRDDVKAFYDAPQCVVGDAAHLEALVGGESQDFVMARHLLQIVPNRFVVYRAVHRTLRHGGKFAFTMIGYNTFNFDLTGNSLMYNPFYSKLLRAVTGPCWSRIMRELTREQKRYLREAGVLTDRNSLNRRALKPLSNRDSVIYWLEQAGFAPDGITYLVLPEVHTVGFKRAFSMTLGSIPIPGVWQIFDLLPMALRYHLVAWVYDEAFGGDNMQPIITHDPLFICVK